MNDILFFFFVEYVIFSLIYTLETALNKPHVKKRWYVSLLIVIWCVLMSWIYFPCDLSLKLYKKLNP